jgi:hypothetical protein
MPDFEKAAQIQRKALQQGRLDKAKGLPVIYIHGRPYADPAHDRSPEEQTESPFPWDLWNQL